MISSAERVIGANTTGVENLFQLFKKCFHTICFRGWSLIVGRGVGGSIFKDLKIKPFPLRRSAKKGKKRDEFSGVGNLLFVPRPKNPLIVAEYEPVFESPNCDVIITDC